MSNGWNRRRSTRASAPWAAVAACVALGCSSSGRSPAWSDDGADPRYLAELPSPAPSVSLPNPPPVADLVRLAIARNPGLRAARERLAAAEETSTIDGWLPDPKVMIGWYETSVQTRVGPQEWSVGIQQDIPFPTKLIARAEIADSDARRQRVVYERLARDLAVDVVKSAHELGYLDRALEISSEIEALLERYASAAAAPSSDALGAELFRAETQRAQLTNDRILLAELREVEAERLRAMLALPPSMTIGTPRMPPAPPIDATLDDLRSIAGRHSLELKEAGVSTETARLRTSLARQRRIPDLSLGITHIETDPLPAELGMDPPGNGDDPLILQLGLSLPLWAPKDAAAIRQAEALERAAALEESAAIESLRERVVRAWFKEGNTRRLVTLYQDLLLPRAAVAARTAEDLLTSGKGSLGGLLETVAVLHNFRLAEARARADHGQAIAELERTLGQPFDLERVTTSPEEEMP